MIAPFWIFGGGAQLAVQVVASKSVRICVSVGGVIYAGGS